MVNILSQLDGKGNWSEKNACITSDFVVQSQTAIAKKVETKPTICTLKSLL